MTIFCDPQSGSCDLIPYFKRYVVPRSLLTTDVLLTSGDVAFAGDGPRGSFVRVGIEVKKLDDVLKCMIDNRYTDEQLGKMVKDYDELHLLIVDEFRPEPTSGYLQKRRRSSNTGRGVRIARRKRGDGAWVPASFSDVHQQKYGSLIKWLGTIQRVMRSAGYDWSVWHVKDEDEAAQWCLAHYEWYNDKRFDQHKAMHGFSTASEDKRVAKKRDGSARAPAPIFLQPDVKLRAKVLGQFDGIGYETAVAIARKFRNVQDIINAGEGLLARVKIGKTTFGFKRARKLYDQIRGIKQVAMKGSTDK